MARAVHVFRDPQRFVVGTVGVPGERTFYLQATDARRVCTVLLEKQQVAILADRLDALLDEVQERFGMDMPPESVEPTDLETLSLPIDSEFRVGTMGLGWDANNQTVVVELLAVTDEEVDESIVLADDDDGPDALRVFITPQQVREFARRSERVVAAGQSACPLCGKPMSGGAHRCVRLNGYHRNRELPADWLIQADS